MQGTGAPFAWSGKCHSDPPSVGFWDFTTHAGQQKTQDSHDEFCTHYELLHLHSVAWNIWKIMAWFRRWTRSGIFQGWQRVPHALMPPVSFCMAHPKRPGQHNTSLWSYTLIALFRDCCVPVVLIILWRRHMVARISELHKIKGHSPQLVLSNSKCCPFFQAYSNV